jgi:hypothetical protein
MTEHLLPQRTLSFQRNEQLKTNKQQRTLLKLTSIVDTTVKYNPCDGDENTVVVTSSFHIPKYLLLKHNII